MSGGSWNYLFCKDIDELMNGSSTELLQDMVDRLNSAGFKDAAKDTQRLVEYIKSASIRIETLFETLSPVFKAVDDFVKVVKKHNWNIRNRNENEFIYGAIDRLAEQLKEGKVNENYNKEES